MMAGIKGPRVGRNGNAAGSDRDSRQSCYLCLHPLPKALQLVPCLSQQTMDPESYSQCWQTSRQSPRTSLLEIGSQFPQTDCVLRAEGYECVIH